MLTAIMCPDLTDGKDYPVIVLLTHQTVITPRE